MKLKDLPKKTMLKDLIAINPKTNEKIILIGAGFPTVNGYCLWYKENSKTDVVKILQFDTLNDAKNLEILKDESIKAFDDTEKNKYCAGCYNDFYNDTEKEGCWFFKKAKIVMRKKVHVNQVPPWKQKPIKTLSCYRQSKYVFVDADKEYSGV